MRRQRQWRQQSVSSRHRRWAARLQGAALGALALLTAASAGAVTITFDDLVHGEVVSDQYVGVTISAVNFRRGIDLAVAFDTTIPSTTDPTLADLLSSSGGATPWSGGNLEGTELGRALVLQKNDAGCGDGICDNPDDEGARMPGQLIFDFDVSVLSFGFDLIDIDDPTEFGSITFYGNGSSVNVPYANFLTPTEVGDNFATRVAPFTAQQLGLAAIDRVVFNLGGSGAIDNIAYVVVPEPQSAALLVLGLLGLAGRTRRRT